MDAESDTGEVMCFWLTLRLCRELIGAMTGFLIRESVAQTSVAPGNVSALQGYLQHRAVEKRAPAKAVAAKPKISSVVNQLQVRTSKEMVRLAFPLADGGEAVLSLKTDEARQWLEILYRQFVVGEWPLDAWPEWIKTSTASVETGGQSSLH